MKRIYFLTICFVSLYKDYNPSPMKYKFNFYTQHSQFYMSSDNGEALTLENDWSIEEYEDRLASLKNFLTVFTQCYGNVKGELCILTKPIYAEYNKYDHIVEAGIEIQSGNLQILNCPNSSVELEVNVKPGSYRVRVYSSNLNTVVGDDGDDYYKIEIWPDTNMERKVLKRYKNH